MKKDYERALYELMVLYKSLDKVILLLDDNSYERDQAINLSIDLSKIINILQNKRKE